MNEAWDSLAREKIKRRKDFFEEIIVFLAVNVVLVLVWLLTSQGETFWPMWTFIGGAFLIAFNAYQVFIAKTVSQQEVAKEMSKLSS